MVKNFWWVWLQFCAGSANSGSVWWRETRNWRQWVWPLCPIKKTNFFHPGDCLLCNEKSCCWITRGLHIVLRLLRSTAQKFNSPFDAVQNGKIYAAPCFPTSHHERSGLEASQSNEGRGSGACCLWSHLKFKGERDSNFTRQCGFSRWNSVLWAIFVVCILRQIWAKTLIRNSLEKIHFCWDFWESSETRFAAMRIVILEWCNSRWRLVLCYDSWAFVLSCCCCLIRLSSTLCRYHQCHQTARLGSCQIFFMFVNFVLLRKFKHWWFFNVLAKASDSVNSSWA